MSRARGFAIAVAIALAATAGEGAELKPGSRVLVEAEGREDYSPRIVECASTTGICLRDTRSQPADKPVEPTTEGWRVQLPAWEVIYYFKPDGTGIVTDMSGGFLGTFEWSQ